MQNNLDKQWNEYKALPLPDDWFATDQEIEEEIVNYKGWIYRQYGKKQGELPCLIFPI